MEIHLGALPVIPSRRKYRYPVTFTVGDVSRCSLLKTPALADFGACFVGLVYTCMGRPP